MKLSVTYEAGSLDMLELIHIEPPYQIAIWPVLTFEVDGKIFFKPTSLESMKSNLYNLVNDCKKVIISCKDSLIAEFYIADCEVGEIIDEFRHPEGTIVPVLAFKTLEHFKEWYDKCE